MCVGNALAITEKKNAFYKKKNITYEWLYCFLNQSSKNPFIYIFFICVKCLT